MRKTLAVFRGRKVGIKAAAAVCVVLVLAACLWTIIRSVRDPMFTDIEIITSRKLEVGGPSEITQVFGENESVCVFVRIKLGADILEIVNSGNEGARLAVTASWFYGEEEATLESPILMEDLGNGWQVGGACLTPGDGPFERGEHQIVIKHGEVRIGESIFWIR